MNKKNNKIEMTEEELRELVSKGVKMWQFHFDWTPSDKMPSIADLVMEELKKKNADT